MTALRNATADRPADPDAPVAEYQPERQPWSHLEMLVAKVADEVSLARWAVIATGSGGKAPPVPEPMRRPGSTPRKRRGMTREQAARIDPRLRAVPDSTAS